MMATERKKPFTLEPDPKGIPPELRALPQWVNWAYEWDETNGRWAKVPYTPGTYRKADTTDRRTWASFDLAMATYEGDPDFFSGVGFVVSDRDPYTGIDLDKCASGLGAEPWAAKIVAKMGSYAELSPSTSGVHIIIKASLPGDRKRKGQIECYDRARFFCITGWPVPRAGA